MSKSDMKRKQVIKDGEETDCNRSRGGGQSTPPHATLMRAASHVRNNRLVSSFLLRALSVYNIHNKNINMASAWRHATRRRTSSHEQRLQLMVYHRVYKVALSIG